MKQPSPSRRALLAAGATSLVGLAGCLGNLTGGTDDTTPENDTNTTPDGGDESETTDGEDEPLDPPENGAVVFVYDDGPMEDYTQALPAHRAFDAPATVGIVSDWIGREDYQENGCMDVEHLEELVDAGWEIASHTVEHTPVGTFELVEDVDPEDARVYPEEIRHGYYRGKPLEITNGEWTINRTVDDYGTDDDGEYIELDEAVGEACSAGETVVRYPADQIREAMGQSKRDLEKLGFEVDTLLAPYDNFDDYSRKFAPEYYDGIANANHGSRINDPEGFDPFYTCRDYFIEFTTSDVVTADLDEIADRGALGVFGAHTFKEEVTEERISETLERIDDRGIEVLTLREAIERYAR